MSEVVKGRRSTGRDGDTEVDAIAWPDGTYTLEMRHMHPDLVPPCAICHQPFEIDEDGTYEATEVGVHDACLDSSAPVRLDVERLGKAMWDGLSDAGVLRIHADGWKELNDIAEAVAREYEKGRRGSTLSANTYHYKAPDGTLVELVPATNTTAPTHARPATPGVYTCNICRGVVWRDRAAHMAEVHSDIPFTGLREDRE